MIWLQADYVIMDLENIPTETIDLWQKCTDLEVLASYPSCVHAAN